MAIWDKKEKTTTLSADSRKCLSCGDNLKFHVQEGYLQCVSCGSVFSPEVFEITAALEEKIEHEIDFDSVKEDEITKFFKENHQEIICNACGSVVVTNRNTISTFCSFCGSPAVIERRIQKEFLPDGIIPFKVTREQAKENILKWGKGLKAAPFGFMNDAVFGKMTPLYVPFWLVDADCQMRVSGSCYKYDVIDSVYHEYMVRRHGSFGMRLVPFDGSKKISDRLMEAIEPYDYSELTDFNDSYLHGVYAERYDQSPSDMGKRIANRFRDYMYDIAVSLTEQNAYDIRKLTNNYSSASNYKCYYALLPVWFINYEYKGATYQIAVNGQTGEVAGKTPVNRLRRFIYKATYDKVALAIYIALAAIVFGVGIFIHKKLSWLDFGVLIYFIIAVFSMFFTSLFAAYRWFRHRTSNRSRDFVEPDQLDKMPDPFTYVDKSQMTLDERRDDHIGIVELPDSRRNNRGYSSLFRYRR